MSRHAAGLVLLLLLTGAALVAQTRIAPKASLSGKIANPRVAQGTIRLRAIPPNPTAAYDGYQAKITANGTFTIDDIDPGSYVLTAEVPRFMPLDYQAGKPLVLAPGQRLNGISFSLTPKRVICGHVTDPDGSPTKAVVSAELRVPEIAFLAHPQNAGTDSDAQGNFRFEDLPPGQYFLYAHGAGNAWFPSAQRFSDAQWIEVGPATDSSCRDDIQLRGGWNAHHIRGTVLGPLLPSEGKDLRVELLEENPATGNLFSDRVGLQQLLRPNQSFDFPFASNGRYRLVIRGGVSDTWYKSPPWYLLASQEIVVQDADVNDIQLQPRFASLSGQVRLENITAREVCPTRERQYVSILRDGDGQYQQAPITTDGAFSFPYVASGTYTVSIFPTLPKSISIGSMILDGRAISASRIEISAEREFKLDATLIAATPNIGFRSPVVPAFERFRQDPALVQGEISGRIANVPAGDLTVTLRPIRFNSRDSSHGYSVRTDADGSYHIASVDPGLYVLAARATGFVPGQYGAAGPGLQGTAIQISPGRRIENLSFTLAPLQTGTICGRLIDQNGDPIANSGVRALGPYDAATRSWNASSPQYFTYFDGYVRTDAAGRYHIANLKPGVYFIRGGGPSGYAYFPSSVGFNGAQLVETSSSAAEPCRADIQARRGWTGRRLHARGRVPETLPPSLGSFFYVTLSATNPTGAEGPWDERPADSNGSSFLIASDQTFDIPDLTPGRYRLHLYGSTGCNFLKDLCMGSGPVQLVPLIPLPLGSQDFTVSDADVDDISIELARRSSVSGQMEFTGDSKRLIDAAQRRGISLFNLTRRRRFDASLAADGSFSFPNVEPGAYTLQLNDDLLQNGQVYATSLFLDGKPVQRGQISVLPETAHSIRVVLATGTGGLKIEVLPSILPRETYSDEPCRERIFGGIAPFRIFLIPETPPAMGRAIFGANSVNPDPVRRYEAWRIPPGRYRVVATEYAGPDSPWFGWDSVLQESASALGQAVEIKAGEVPSITIRNSTVELQAVRARLREPLGRNDY